VEARAAPTGALYIAQPAGVIVLSVAQVRLLLALAPAPLGLGPREVAAVLWGVAVAPSRRRSPLTPARRASQARTLRRLRTAGLVETPGNVRLTPKGRALAQGLTSCDGWADYAARWSVQPGELDRRVG
jgi:hypothetical protein